MRKFALLAASIAAVFAVVAVASATQTNTYSVVGKVLPTNAKASAPVSVLFNYTVGEKAGQRPANVTRYDIAFQGVSENSGHFPGCSNAAINAAKSFAGCPKGSVVGHGAVENISGQTSNPNDKSIMCHLDLTLVNGKPAHHLNIYLHGSPNNPKGACPISVDQAIDAKMFYKGGAGHVRFDVAKTLYHPIPGFDNSVVNAKSTVDKKVVTHRHAGKVIKEGFFYNKGCPKNHKRTISVTFTQEDGQVYTTKTTTSCH